MGKKALIIGAAGFVGSYLAEHLKKYCGMQVFVTKLPHEEWNMDGVKAYDLDILQPEAVGKLFDTLQPDYIFHLAAQSSVALSWKKPDLTVDVNIKGCVNILEEARKLEKKPNLLLVGSGEEYGAVSPEDIPVSENLPIHPGNIYAVTKACQNQIGALYAKAYGMNIIMIRAFNHIGPGQASQFVVSDFCRQVAEIEAGKREPVMYVGNLAAKRDFTDVRDIVSAYAMIIEKGTSGETYNVGSGKAVAIQDILDTILRLSPREIKVEIDPGKFRPVDVPVIEADISKLQECTGWKPEIDLVKTIKEVIEYWRERV